MEVVKDGKVRYRCDVCGRLIDKRVEPWTVKNTVDGREFFACNTDCIADYWAGWVVERNPDGNTGVKNTEEAL